MRPSYEALIVIAVLVMPGCGSPTGGSGTAATDTQAEYRAQVDAYNRQTQEQDELRDRSHKVLEQTESDNARARKLIESQEKDIEQFKIILAKQEMQMQRYDKILLKLEEQARRKDTILDAEEKQLGIRK